MTKLLKTEFLKNILMMVQVMKFIKAFTKHGINLVFEIITVETLLFRGTLCNREKNLLVTTL